MGIRNLVTDSKILTGEIAHEIQLKRELVNCKI